MEIVPYGPSMKAELAATYNRIVQSVPHCYPVEDKAFGHALVPAVGVGDPHPRLHSETVFTAREGSAFVGLVHTAVGALKKGEAERGSIRFLGYERGHRAAGQALLEAAESDLRGKGMDQIEVLHWADRYPFYHLKHAYLSDHLDHVQALLKRNGYRASGGEVVLDWPGFPPHEPSFPGGAVKIALEWSKARGRLPNLVLRGRRDGEEIGLCESVSCGEFSGAAAAQDWLHVSWLWVRDDLRGRGWGRYLLQRSLQEMHQVGYRNASISTDSENHRALLFYSNAGFHAVDWTHRFRRELE